MSYTDWMELVEFFLGYELGSSKWADLFEYWWTMKLSPRDAAARYRKVLNVK